MDRTARLYRIDQLLNEHKLVPLNIFLSELEVSLATFKRDLEYLRDRLNAPIIWDRELGGYRFEKNEVGSKYELPGLWLNASEIHALLTMQQLLKNVDAGLLAPHVEPLLSRLRSLLGSEGIPLEVLEKRIRIQRLNARQYESEHFLPVVTAVLKGKRLSIVHNNKRLNESTQREISPQRLNYYRENWYVDAWCHLRDEIRSFALDALDSVEITDLTAKPISDELMHQELDSSYGIFSGKKLNWAELEFSSERARWVSKECWHPDQVSWTSEDGIYHIRIPFSDDRELLMDVLSHIPEVRIVSPQSLRLKFKECLQNALNAM